MRICCATRPERSCRPWPITAILPSRRSSSAGERCSLTSSRALFDVLAAGWARPNESLRPRNSPRPPGCRAMTRARLFFAASCAKPERRRFVDSDYPSSMAPSHALRPGKNVTGPDAKVKLTDQYAAAFSACPAFWRRPHPPARPVIRRVGARTILVEEVPSAPTFRHWKSRTKDG